MLIIIKLAPLVLMAAAVLLLMRGENGRPDYFWSLLSAFEAFFIQFGMLS